MYGRRKAKPIGFSNRDDPKRLVTVGIHYIVDLDNVDKDLVTDNDRLTKICDTSLEMGERLY